MSLKGKSLIEPLNFTVAEMEELFDLSQRIINAPRDYAEVCKGYLLAALFYEPSTRTRFSFEAAMLRLGGQVIGFSEPGSSAVSKGESIADTIRTVECYADIAVMRHPKEGAVTVARDNSRFPVINAGDGGHHHPTQTLTDLLTIRLQKGSFDNITVGMCGDLKFGRTVHSLIAALLRYSGVRFVLISPEELRVPGYVRESLKIADCTETENLTEVMPTLDVLYMTRVQKERFFNEEDYVRLKDRYILDNKKLTDAKESLMILHPLPRVNEIAAEVVFDIFKQALSGVSCQGIAKRLNSLGVLSPLEYKKSVGLGCSDAFKTSLKAKWSAVTVKRILCDEVYTGVLIQGKTTTPSHKVKSKIVKDKSEWARAENAHEAIVSVETFQLVNDLLSRDSYKTDVYMFSGMLFCSKCGHNLVRKISTVNGTKYINHACLKMHKNDKRDGCSGIRIKESELFEAVAAALKAHIDGVLEIEEILKFAAQLPQNERNVQKLQEQIEAKKAEISRLENRKVQLYEDYSDRKIKREEYAIFSKNYNIQIVENETAIENLERELEKKLADVNQDNSWIEYFKEYRDFTDLSREVIVKFIDRIIVFAGVGRSGGSRLEIVYRHGDEWAVN